jgi:hypothetical protein
MLEKLKELSPKVVAVVSLAPFAFGVLIGYVARTPIGWLIDLVSAVL